MDDPFGLRGVEGVGELNRDFEQTVCEKCAGAQLLIEVLSLEKFHGDERLCVLTLPSFHGVDRANVGMVQSRGGAGLQKKAVKRVLIARELLGQELQRHFASQAQVFGFVDHAMPPLPNWPVMR